MPEQGKLTSPWLIAAWPGMGHVAVSAGYYLMAKLGMHQIAEFQAQELFDIDHVEVKNGIVRTGRLPRSRFFAWTDPSGQHDLVVFIGEGQPPLGKYAYCRKVVEYAKSLGVERVITFAAMATAMHPSNPSRIFGVATEEAGLAELQRHGLEPLEDGQIGGLNGVLLGAAAEAGMSGLCLLGEMPHVFAQLPFPKASLAVLTSFASISGMKIDVGELEEQAAEMDQKLTDLIDQMQHAMEDQQAGEEVEPSEAEPEEEQGLTALDQGRIEELFARASSDRSVAYELKRELDRLGVYMDYEDRFLDLFKPRP